MNPFFKREIILFLLFFPVFGNAQKHNKIEVVILGTFHFGESNDFQSGKLDDILTYSRQRQIHEIVRKLARFAPHKIFVENTPDAQPYWDQVYKEWVKGNIPADPNSINNEIFQFGIKLAAVTKNPFGVRCINYHLADQLTDVGQILRSEQLYQDYSRELLKNRPSYPDFLRTNLLAAGSFNSFMTKNKEWQKLTLREHLIKMNEAENLRALQYFNVLAWMDTNTNRIGAELSAQEYTRNLKILQNIYLNLSPQDKRILIIIGAAHAQILKDMMKSHPVFEVLEATDILK